MVPPSHLPRPAQFYIHFCFSNRRVTYIHTYIQYGTSKRKHPVCNQPSNRVPCRSSALFHAVPTLTTTCETDPDRILVAPDPPRASSSHPNCGLSCSSSAIRLCYLRLLTRRRATAILAHPDWISGVSWVASRHFVDGTSCQGCIKTNTNTDSREAAPVDSRSSTRSSKLPGQPPHRTSLLSPLHPCRVATLYEVLSAIYRSPPSLSNLSRSRAKASPYH